MDLSTNEIIKDFSPFFRVFKDGRVERHFVMEPATARLDPKTGVQSKDVVVSPGVRARIFMPEIRSPDRKLPLLVHYHGGGFSNGSAFDTLTQKLVTPLVIQANIIIISIDYRLAPEHLLPIAYDDSWAALQWVTSHANGQGPEPWLNEKADLGRVFLGGESAGANIAHYVAVQAGATKLVGLKIIGMLIVHPFFGSKEIDEYGMYKYICPTSAGFDHDPKLNPKVDPNLNQLPCDKVIVLVAEKDTLRSRGEAYYETLVTSGWGGNVEFFETKGEDHCFHVFIDNDNAEVLKKKMVDFIKTD
ncbi:2-hydroxyisoflavanone dehydratase-like [Durio zibethinus]|uniref:2-hydroxyisoflavanone dehydratase-like n=1 Tax=Durio zibethinus TaxID=66656 RepID=A0A6P5XGZ5_DURZI|nr:2-hydroxyisoflavanone dehydratase-like [Durio zibethinus]